MIHPLRSIFLFLLCISFGAAAQTDTSAQRIIRSISITGNKTTKAPIIFRELTFHENDTLTALELTQRFKRSRENLLNTSLFNFITITSKLTTDSTSTDVTIDVRERWYVWPSPIFEIAEQNFNTWWVNGRNLERANYGLYLVRENFRGRRETITMKCRLGYNEQYGLTYTVPYLNKKQTIGLSAAASFSRSHETPFETRNNRFVFFKNTEAYVREEWGGALGITYRNGLYLRHIFEFRVVDADYNLPENIVPESFGAPLQNFRYAAISWRHSRDFRDSKPYPLHGHISEFEFSKLGLYLFKNEPNIILASVTLRGFAEPIKRVYTAASIRARFLVSDNQPFPLRRALGFTNYIRGYEYDVIDGSDYVLIKSGIKYALIQPRILRVPFLPLEKFNTLHYALYGGFFGDAAFVSDDRVDGSAGNTLVNTWLLGYGVGLDFVTYYDTVVRLEAGLNKQGQPGFFLHLNAGI